ncbi:MAG: peptidoglycan DD-metalloendopeptidase family protein [Acidobacteria bacterium]|nr:peptidoglycan DD-metalloendopeptidase family protein [Acidobacteriota bacterium]
MIEPADAAAPSATAPARAAAERARIARLAHEFEAMLIAQMLRGMRESMLPDDSAGQGLGVQTMTETFDEALGGVLSRAGGIGLATLLQEALSRRLVTSVPSGAPAPDMALPPPIAAPASRPSTIAHLPITSAFGWRRDPMIGQQRFHAGVDLRAAYGQDVHALSGGRVVFSGVQGGYGLTVVVDDGAGTRTRYAHLSTAEVVPGDEVNAGALLARSGNSGRSTGPHVHIEVRRDGHPVDPAPLIDGSAWTRTGAVPRTEEFDGGADSNGRVNQERP